MNSARAINCFGANFRRCHSFGYTFRKEGHTKIVEYDLSEKFRQQNLAMGKRRPNVLDDQNRARPQAHAETTANGDLGSEDEDEDDEEEGEDVFSEEDDEQPAHMQNHTHPVAKSITGKVKGKRGRNERVMAPEECRAHLRRLFKNEAVVCSLLFGRHGPYAPLTRHKLSLASADMFFMDVLPVSPTRFRPPAKMGETLFEHPQNELLTRVLSTSYRLRDLNNNLRAATDKNSGVDEAAVRRMTQSLLDALIQLQVDVNSFMDSSKNPTPVRQGKLPPAGVKQSLEKKEGLFRKHMMVRRFICVKFHITSSAL